eukprot:Skav230488  [mRNA]  locus=scaffold1182:10210:10836:+ [translate_table: standard]
MPGRGGGNRKFPIPAVDEDALQEVMDLAVSKFRKKPFCLGAYDEVKTTMGASGPGLLECQWWLKRLVPLCSGEIALLHLKVAIKKYAHQLNDSKYKHDLRASQQASKFRVVLNHWRRLRLSEVKRRQAMQKMGKLKKEALQALLDLQPGLPNTMPKNNDSSAPEACNTARSPVKSTGACDKAMAAVSPVSLDQDGYPQIVAAVVAQEA